MTEEKQQIKEIDYKEIRHFYYSKDENDLSFDFEIDVSNPELALAEISDFRDLMAQAFHDLDTLSKKIASKIGQKKEQKEDKKKKTKTENIKEISLDTAQDN